MVERTTLAEVRDVRVAGARDELFRRRALAARVDRRSRLPRRLGLEDRFVDSVVFSGVAEARFLPRSVDYLVERTRVLAPAGFGR